MKNLAYTLNDSLEKNIPYYIERIEVPDFCSGKEYIKELLREYPEYQVVVLVDNDGTIDDERYSSLFKYPLVSHLTVLLNSGIQPYSDENMKNLKELSEIADICIATNRSEDEVSQVLFLSQYLMGHLRNRMAEFDIDIDVFTLLNKQIAGLLPNSYGDIIRWVKERRNTSKKLMIINLADVDIATPSHLEFLDAIILGMNDPKVEGKLINIKP